ncbi:MAG: hypothetical protein VW547_12775, partial [Alphaproteobacteria bacterium]
MDRHGRAAERGVRPRYGSCGDRAGIAIDRHPVQDRKDGNDARRKRRQRAYDQRGPACERRDVDPSEDAAPVSPRGNFADRHRDRNAEQHHQRRNHHRRRERFASARACEPRKERNDPDPVGEDFPDMPRIGADISKRFAVPEHRPEVDQQAAPHAEVEPARRKPPPGDDQRDQVAGPAQRERVPPARGIGDRPADEDREGRAKGEYRRVVAGGAAPPRLLQRVG